MVQVRIAPHTRAHTLRIIFFTDADREVIGMLADSHNKYGVLEVIHPCGNGYDLGNASAQQGDDHNDHHEVLDNSAACKLVHDLKVLGCSFLMPTLPCPGSHLQPACMQSGMRINFAKLSHVAPTVQTTCM